MNTDFSKVSGLYLRRLRGLNYTDLVDCITQDCRVDFPRGRNLTRRVVSRFLQQVPDVSAGPFPADFVAAGGSIESFPPRQVRFTSKTSVHGFDDVAGICKNVDLTGLAQRFQADGGGSDFSLLICRAPEILADCTPEAFVSEQGDARRARRLLAVSQTRAVAKDGYLLKWYHGLT